MKLQQIRYLAGVVDTGSITEAARRLNVSQPALSAGLAALEAELGGPLLQRKRGRAQLTSLGARFYRRAAAILHECELAKTEFKRGLEKSAMRIGVLPTVPVSLVTGLVRHVADLMPGTDIELQDGWSRNLATWLKQRRIDAAITAAAGAIDGGWLPLFEEPFVLVCAKGHRYARANAVALEDLQDEAFILRGHCERQADAMALFEARGVKVRIVYRTDHEERAVRMVAEGLGVSIVPASAIPAEAVPVPIEDFGLRRTVGILMAPRLDRKLAQMLTKAASHVAGDRR